MSNNIKKIEYYSWEQFDKDCERIAHWAKRFSFKNIYGIPRAGAIVAVRLSYLLNIELITDPHEIENPQTLVVDDIMRTGETVAVLEEHVGDFVVATLLWSGENFEPDYYARKIKGDVFFPWQKKLDSTFENPSARAMAMVAKIQEGGSIKIDKKGLA